MGQTIASTARVVEFVGSSIMDYSSSLIELFQLPITLCPHLTNGDNLDTHLGMLLQQQIKNTE